MRADVNNLKREYRQGNRFERKLEFTSKYSGLLTHLINLFSLSASIIEAESKYSNLLVCLATEVAM